MSGWMYGMGWGWLVFLLFLTVVVAGVVMLSRNGMSQSRSGRSRAEEILQKRYAQGEIEREEYEKMRQSLATDHTTRKEEDGMPASRQRGWGIGLLIVVLGLLTLWVWMRPFGVMGGFGHGFNRNYGRNYDTNGEQIYFTATSQRGTPITADMDGGWGTGNMPMMGRGAMACVDCHGPDGRGGQARMMMASYTAPNIRWEALAAEDHGDTGAEDDHGDEAEAMEHPPYTEETLKRAITQGVDPAGEPLAWPMPQWRMGAEDLADLVDYLKTLD